ncbi:MAG: hypothetical protein QXW91_05805 [Candidatus Nitrosotenuis sp.]
MNAEWIIVGIILFGGMTAGGINLYLKRRRQMAGNDGVGNDSVAGSMEL